MSIGSTIKKLRHEREMTQEQLAEYLGITANAVSQWECDRTAPDISQLPMLARVLQVSTDRLLGIDFSKDEEEIERILDESAAYATTGEFTKALETTRNGLKQYPQSFHLMARLAENLYSVKSSEDEIERICDKILKECAESGPRDHACRLKIMLYGKRGEHDKILELANKLPHIWVSREEMLMRWNFDNSEKRHAELVGYAKFYIKSLTTCLGKIASLTCYSYEEKIRLRKQIIDILQVIYPEKDYLSNGGIIASNYYLIASLYIKSGEYDQALDALEKSHEYFMYCDHNDGRNTSLAFRGCNVGEWHPNEHSFSREFFALLRQDATFEPLHKHPRFIKMTKQQIYNGESEP